MYGIRQSDSGDIPDGPIAEKYSTWLAGVR